MVVRLLESYCGKALLERLQEEGFHVSKCGVSHVLKKWRKDKILFDYPRSGRPKILHSATHNQISQWLTANNELTLNDLLVKLYAQGITASRSSISRVLKRMGWSAHATRYCQLIREQNKLKRIEFCQKLQRDGDSFDDVIFTDEAMIQLKPAHRKSYHKKGQQQRYRGKPKHPVKVYVWGGGGGGFLNEVLQMSLFLQD